VGLDYKRWLCGFIIRALKFIYKYSKIRFQGLISFRCFTCLHKGFTGIRAQNAGKG
jgi:hypothetical protein